MHYVLHAVVRHFKHLSLFSLKLVVLYINEFVPASEVQFSVHVQRERVVEMPCKI
jgi:hypothetical protein